VSAGRSDGQLFETVEVPLLQFAKGGTTELRTGEQADFPQCLAYEHLAWLAEQFSHVRISIGQHSRVGIEQEYSVWRCFEKPPVAHFRGI